VKELSALELQHLLSDNRASFDEYERRFPGAGIGLEDRIRARIEFLQNANGSGVRLRRR
jgi:hypothetical protein